MKKTISIAIILVFCAFLNVAAQDKKTTEETQEKKITDAEFKAVQKKSADQSAGKNYRLKRSSKTYNRVDNSLSRYFNETIEYMLPDASRSVLENASAGEKPACGRYRSTRSMTTQRLWPTPRIIRPCVRRSRRSALRRPALAPRFPAFS